MIKGLGHRTNLKTKKKSPGINCVSKLFVKNITYVGFLAAHFEHKIYFVTGYNLMI